MGLGTQTERAADALHVHADHAGALLAARERGDRHPREIAHRPVRSVSQRGSDLGAQGVELIVAELLQAGRVLLVNPVASGSDLAGAEEETFEHELEDAPVLLALCERRGERLAEVLLRGPADLAEHREGVEQLGGANCHPLVAQLLGQLQDAGRQWKPRGEVVLRRHRRAIQA